MKRALPIVLLAAALQALPAQAGLSAVQLVPPLHSRPLLVPLLSREILPSQQPATVMSIVRYGHSADPRAPFGFPMSEEGQAAQLQRLDWLRAGSRRVEIRGWPEFAEWLQLDRGTQVLILSPTEVSLWSGVTQWRTVASDNAYLLRLGTHELFGDGQATIERTPWALSVRVDRGRFFLRGTDGTLTRLLAGEAIRLSSGATPADPPMPEAAQGYARAERQMRTILAATVVEWIEAAALTRERQDSVFEAAEAFGPWYSYAARQGIDWPTAPDRSQAQLGELLRFLNALEFVVPPLAGR